MDNLRDKLRKTDSVELFEFKDVDPDSQVILNHQDLPTHGMRIYNPEIKYIDLQRTGIIIHQEKGLGQLHVVYPEELPKDIQAISDKILIGEYNQKVRREMGKPDYVLLEDSY